MIIWVISVIGSVRVSRVIRGMLIVVTIIIMIIIIVIMI